MEGRSKTPVIEMSEVPGTPPIRMLRDGGRSLTMPQDKKKKSLTDYFAGPRDMQHFSKWPFFLRLHGSISPKMIVPLFLVAAWSSIFTVICKTVYKGHNFDPILLTVLGFVVGLSLSFRSTTAYERYSEGRRYWAQLHLTIHNLARIVWIHCKERDDTAADDLLGKVSLLNLLVSFAYALQHRLRFEPYTAYEDLRDRIQYLDTYAGKANPSRPSAAVRIKDGYLEPTPTGKLKRFGDFLGIPFSRDNPRRVIKQAQSPLGNLPLELLVHMQSYFDAAIEDGRFKAPIYQMQCINSLQTMNDILTGCDRILTTPLPVAYSICISQITWTYIVLLPIMLYRKLGWFTVPATVVAAYIILGLAFIGQEIENPFGDDVNDLPLEGYCRAIQADIEMIASTESGGKKAKEDVAKRNNRVLWPLSADGYDEWKGRGVEGIRDALRSRVYMGWRMEGELAMAGMFTPDESA